MEPIRNFPDSELVANLRSGFRMDEMIKTIYRNHFDSLGWYVMNNSGSRYKVFIDGQNGYNDTTINNVIVRNKEDTHLPTVTLHQ